MIDVSVPKRSVTRQEKQRLHEKRKARIAASLAPPIPGGVMTIEQAAAYLTLSISSLARMRINGNGPAFVRLAPQKIGYRLSDLDAYIESRIKRSTAE